MGGYPHPPLNGKSVWKKEGFFLVCLCSLPSGWGRFTGEGPELRNKIPTTTTRAHLLQRHPGRGLADKDVETHLRNRVKNLWEVRSVQAANCLHRVVESLEEKLALKRYRCLNIFFHPYVLINISECLFSLNPSLFLDSNLVNPSQLCLLSSRPKICNYVLSLHKERNNTD